MPTCATCGLQRPGRGARIPAVSKPIVAIEEDRGITVISFPAAGSDPAGNDAIREWIAEHFLDSTAHTGRLIVDLSGVNALDSSALGPLIQRLRDLQRRRGRMALAGVASPAMREVLSLTRFDQVFRIFPNRNEALAAVAEDPTARFARV